MTIVLFFIILINYLIFLNFYKISNFINLYDFPYQKHKIHKRPVALMGGIIFIINIFLLFIIDKFTKIIFFNIFSDIADLYIFLLVLSFFFIVGLFDDKYNITPIIRLFLFILVSTIHMMFDKKLQIQMFSLSFYDHKIFFHEFSIIFSIFCIIILINALNFYDGLNGQSLSFLLMVFSYLLITTKRYEFYGLIIIILFFLFFLNLKNKIFLGDSGIYSIGFVLSISFIYEHNVHKNIIYADEIFLLLLLPGLDLLRLTIFRLYKKKNPLLGDRNHIHHILHNKFSLLNTNLILFFLSIMPIFLYSVINLNFFIALTIFTITYIFVIYRAKSND